jgi:aminoglycoside phosphotransferase
MSGDAIDSSQARPGSRAASSLGWRLTAAMRDIVARLGLLGQAQRLVNLRTDRRRARRAKRIVPPIIARLSASVDHANSASWRFNRVVPTVSDVLVVKAGPAEQPSEALIKIAETPAAAKGLKWQVEALKTLTGDQRLGDWRELLPQLLDAGEADTWAYLVETRVTGVNLEHALHDQAGGDAALREAAEAIGHLHTATSELLAVDAKHLDRWVREPMRLLASATNDSGKHGPARPALERLSAELCEVLEPQRIVLSWVHGDYAPGNILMGPDNHVSGIVDWEFAHSSDFPSLDIVTLLLTVRMYTRRQELGRVVCDMMATPHWSEVESDLVAATPDAETWQSIGVSQIVLLCWLRHTAWIIERCSRYATSGLWLHTNVQMVLDALQDNA